jgi:Bacterial mobilisation protein (MobC)
MVTRKPARINKISVRFTDRELDLIHARAEAIDLNRTAYIQRQALQNRDIEAIPKPIVDASRMLLLKELRIQGNNINQIAKGINRANLLGESLGDYKQLLTDIKYELKRLCHND